MASTVSIYSTDISLIDIYWYQSYIFRVQWYTRTPTQFLAFWPFWAEYFICSAFSSWFTFPAKFPRFLNSPCHVLEVFRIHLWSLCPCTENNFTHLTRCLLDDHVIGWLYGWLAFALKKNDTVGGFVAFMLTFEVNTYFVGFKHRQLFSFYSFSTLLTLSTEYKTSGKMARRMQISMSCYSGPIQS